LSSKQVAHEEVVWVGKPWVIPIAVIRTITVIVVGIVFWWLEIYSDLAFTSWGGFPVYAWTLLVFGVIWLISLLDLLIFWASNTYVLRQNGLEVRRGILGLHSFVVTPSGFGDLMVYQSVGGRVFGYGDLTVNSQGERETKLSLIRLPFETANILRDIMGKPIVRVENPA
jgi:uncharacterized membrane protein YdbT with pleckstrin-like domain